MALWVEPFIPLDFVVAKERRNWYKEEVGSKGFALPGLHTQGHIDCPQCEQSKVIAMQNQTGITPSHLYEAASELWLESRRPPYLKPDTWEMYRYYDRKLKEFFSGMKLGSIHAGHVREYQKKRTDAGVGSSGINHEISCVLAPVLKQARMWTQIKPFYERIPESQWTKPKVMTDEEEDHLFKIAASNPDWSVAYWCSSVTCNSTVSGTELRHLRLNDPNFEKRYFDVRAETAKGEIRGRRVPMNETSYKQLWRLYERAKNPPIRAFLGEHFLIPFRVKRGVYDVTRPASRSFMRKQFRAMVEAAGLEWVTPHCFRHQCITKLYENGATDEGVVEIAGWVSPRMKRIYCKPRMEFKRGLLAQIDPAARK